MDTTLLWSEQGEIACAEHAPDDGTDTRHWGRWEPITPAEARAYAREVGRAPSCETCAAITRASQAGDSDSAGRG